MIEKVLRKTMSLEKILVISLYTKSFENRFWFIFKMKRDDYFCHIFPTNFITIRINSKC